MEKIKIFAVADIHGHATILKNTLDEAGFEKNNGDHLLVVCGDLFDRGHENRAVLRYLKGIKNKILVRGNHEDRLLSLLKTRRLNFDVDVHNGTDITVREFFGDESIDSRGRLYPDEETVAELRDLVCGMLDYYETESYIFTHGWLPLDRDEMPPVICSDWRTAPHSAWPYARFTGWQDAYSLGLTLEDKTIVCGHRTVSYATRFDPRRTSDDYTPFFGDNVIAIDACTVVSGKMNVLVLDELVKEPKEHAMTLPNAPFDNVRQGTKRVEMRLYDENCASISPGDTVRFSKADAPEEQLSVRIVGAYRYPDFLALARDFSPEELGFEGMTSAYIGGFMSTLYSDEDQKKQGVVALKMQLIK